MTSSPRCSPKPFGHGLAADHRFGPALKVTLWLGGLLVALMTGNMAAYLVLTALYFGSKMAGQLRRRGRPDKQLESGRG